MFLHIHKWFYPNWTKFNVRIIEGFLGSRPITPLSSDPHDLCALTPGHFLIALPDLNLSNIYVNTLTRWQLIRQCYQSYWERWSREYLSALQRRYKGFKSFTDLGVNDMVITETASRPPTEWHLGRITEVHPGTNNIVRVVSVRTQDGTYKRPIVKFMRLSID